MKITPMKIFWLLLGFISLVLGTIGVFLPILPTVPFYLLTAFSFAKSSDRLHTWFLGTRLYKKHLESFVERKSMLLKTKLSIITSVTLLMGFGFFMMARKGIWVPCIILAIVWLCHIIYFVFCIKTERPPLSPEQIEEKRKKEESLVTEMIRFYCRKNHKEVYNRKNKEMCPECKELAEYAVSRSEHCPYMQEKTFCSNCKTHCYKPEMRDTIKKVMRFSGPRIMLYHPILALWHLISSLHERKEVSNDKNKAD